jgi:hypothetical protein
MKTDIFYKSSQLVIWWCEVWVMQRIQKFGLSGSEVLLASLLQHIWNCPGIVASLKLLQFERY